MRLLVSFAFWSLVSWVALGWSRLPGALRAWIPRALLVAALALFGAAPFLEGSYTGEVILFIGGPNPYHVENVEHSYTLLAAGLALALLALGALATWADRLPATTPVARALRLTLALLVLRVWLEKLGVPSRAVMFVGIIWLIVPLAVFFGVEAARRGSQGLYWKWLLGYTYSIRGLILVVMLIATHFRLGSHFDNSSVTRYSIFGRVFEVESGSWEQSWNLIVLPQLLLWPAVTLAAGLLLGLPAYFFARRKTSSSPVVSPIISN